MSSSLERVEKFYPDQHTKKMLNCYANASGVSKSRIVLDAIKEKFDRLPKAERDRILNTSKNR